MVAVYAMGRSKTHEIVDGVIGGTYSRIKMVIIQTHTQTDHSFLKSYTHSPYSTLSPWFEYPLIHGFHPPKCDAWGLHYREKCVEFLVDPPYPSNLYCTVS